MQREPQYAPFVQQYLDYLITNKGRSHHTIQEYRIDLSRFSILFVQIISKKASNLVASCPLSAFE